MVKEYSHGHQDLLEHPAVTLLLQGYSGISCHLGPPASGSSPGFIQQLHSRVREDFPGKFPQRVDLSVACGDLCRAGRVLTLV